MTLKNSILVKSKYYPYKMLDLGEDCHSFGHTVSLLHCIERTVTANANLIKSKLLARNTWNRDGDRDTAIKGILKIYQLLLLSWSGEKI